MKWFSPRSICFLVLWRIEIPRKVKFFSWQVLHDRKKKKNRMDRLKRKMLSLVGPFLLHSL